MAFITKPYWRWRISLRMLLLLVGALALFLGYHVNWLHERHVLLAKYGALADSVVADSEFLRDEWRWRNPAEAAVEPPGLLALFGEEGVGELWIVFYSDDPSLAATTRAAEFRRAKRLFPEADVWFSEFPRDPHKRLGRALQYRHAAN